MRGSVRLAAAVAGSIGFATFAFGQQPAPQSQKPSLSVTPGRAGTPNANAALNQPPATLKQQLKETQDRLLAYEAENQALRRRNDSNKEAIHTLTEGLAVANAECEVFRRQYGELKLRMEALGLASVGDNKSALEERLLQSVRDLALVRDEKDVLAERLVALSETVMLYMKTATNADPQIRLSVEEQLRESSKAADDTAAKDAEPASAPAGLNDGRVQSFKEEYSLIVVNLGSRQGVKIGTPFLVTRDGRLVARARVIDVRERYSGAIIEEYSSNLEKVKVGDQMHVDVQS